MPSIVLSIVATAPVTITAADSPYSARVGDFIRCDATDGPIIINLPEAVGEGGQLFFKKLDASENTCTAQSGNSTVNRAPAVVAVRQDQSISLSDGAKGSWDIF